MEREAGLRKRRVLAGFMGVRYDIDVSPVPRQKRVGPPFRVGAQNRRGGGGGGARRPR